MIAALFVQTNGCYYGLPGVDPWDEARDARLYPGPHAVVAHPPCNRWSMPLAKVNQSRYGHRIGDDGGCFAAALAAVRTYGGVLEHPASSAAWPAFELPKPVCGAWTPSPCGGWVTQVAQSAYGHRARKRTWLYAFGCELPALSSAEPPSTVVTSWLQRTKTTLPRITKREASATPPAFRDVLLAMARSVPRQLELRLERRGVA